MTHSFALLIEFLKDTNEYQRLKSELDYYFNLPLDKRIYEIRKKYSHLTLANLISTYITNLLKAKDKLPHYYEALCIIPINNYEQSSSEKATQLKITQNYGRVLDLSCGLGVDCYQFAIQSDWICAVDCDSELIQINQYNFDHRQLNCHNIEWICQKTEDFLESVKKNSFDLIYLDPSRRDNKNNRLHHIADCSPNILKILPKIWEVSPDIWLKTSPLFDYQEGIRLLPNTQAIEFITINGECKEIIYKMKKTADLNNPPALCLKIYRNNTYFEFQFDSQSLQQYNSNPISDLTTHFERYIYFPDIAFKVSRTQKLFFAQICQSLNPDIINDHGVFFSTNTNLDSFPGTGYQMLWYLPFENWNDLSKIKKMMPLQFQIRVLNLKFSDAEAYKKLNHKPSGNHFLLLTSYQNKRFALCLLPILN